MNPNEAHYCFHCLTLISKKEIVAHLRLGHDVDEKSQGYYEEIERAAGVAA